MSHTEISSAAPAKDAAAIPSNLLARIGTTARPQGVVFEDGRIAAMADPLLDGLGFDPVDDLRGLPFTSLWHHSERPAVDAALRRARAGKVVRLKLDLSYLQHRDAECEVTLTRLKDARLVMATINCPVATTSGPTSG